MSCKVITTSLKVLLIANLLTIGLYGCGGSGGGEDEYVAPTPVVALGATSGSAASNVEVTGLNIDKCPLGSAEFKVAGETAPVVLNRRGEIIMQLPVFYDDSTQWAAPPNGPQDVEIFCKDSLLTTLPGAITVTELPPAPGTTEAIIDNYARIISDYRYVVGVLAPVPGIEQQIFSALFDALEDFFHGTGAESLNVMFDELTQNNPEVLALLDAMHAASGVDKEVADFRGMLQEMSGHAAALTVTVPVESMGTTTSSAAQLVNVPTAAYIGDAAVYTIEGFRYRSDVELAKEMQARVILSNFSKTFIKNTASTFAKFVGWASMVSAKFKLAETIDSALFTADFVMNKLVVSTMPSTLDKIKLELAVTEFQNSEVTFARFTIQASNDPEPIAITEITSVAMNSLGLFAKDVPGGQWVNSLEVIAQKSLLQLAGMIDKGLEDILDEDYDRELFAIIPQMYFYAEGKTRHLYKLFPDHVNVIKPLEEQLQWQASETLWGQSNLSVAPGNRPESSFWGSLYSGNAFGENNDIVSNKVPVTVGDLALVLEQHSVIVPEGGSAIVGVKLSNEIEEDQEVLVYAERRSGDSDISVTSAHRIFEASNWDRYQYAVLAAAEDEDDIDDQAVITVWSTFDKLDGSETTIEEIITAWEDDNDGLFFVSNTSTVSVPEGSTATFDVKLSEQPPAVVTATITHAGGDGDISVQSPVSLVFSQSNWDSYQTVTLYARPDEDSNNGSAEITVSADIPGLGDKTITAVEAEGGVSLWIKFEGWRYWTTTGDYIRESKEGAVPVSLDPQNYSYPIGIGTIGATYESSFAGNYAGIAYVTVTNSPDDEVCFCGADDCYTRSSPDDIILAVDFLVDYGNTSDVSASTVGAGIPVPLLQSGEFSTTCGDSTEGASYEFKLLR